MAYTPVELRHVTLGRGPVGYRRGAVDRLLLEVADSFEQVWRDRADLADRVEQLEGELQRYRELDSLLRTTLVSAEKASHELKAQAQREVEVMLAEGRAEARALTREAAAERDSLLGEARRARAILQAALAALEELDEPREGPEDSDETRPEAAAA